MFYAGRSLLHAFMCTWNCVLLFTLAKRFPREKEFNLINTLAEKKTVCIKIVLR